MEVYAIRHPDYVAPYDEQGRRLVHGPEVPVSDLGRLQTRQLSATLRKMGVRLDSIYSSPYPRAWEMAVILKRELQVPKLYKVDGLKDIFPNSANGKLWADLEAIGGDIYKTPMGDGPQETLEDLTKRARITYSWIRYNAESNDEKTVAVISHGDTLSAGDWSLRHSLSPNSYREMEQAFYLQRGEAWKYIFDQNLVLAGGELITTDAAKVSTEGFRGPSKQL